jgi:nucleolar GTP-binding protein
MPQNPFESFEKVIDADELMDIAYRKGTHKSPSIPSTATSIMKAKRKEVSRVQNVTDYLLQRIKKIVQSVPNIDELHPFYKELSQLLVNNDLFKQNLGKLNGLIPVLEKLQSEAIRNINEQDSPNKCAKMRMQFFGRTSSILRKQNSTLNFLEEARISLKIIPTIDTALPSIVVAGYPNVGKSSLVTFLSTAKPEIADYPFTTKQIYIGVHHELNQNYKQFQIIDTPGILDRPMAERNEIEKQAILALRIVANIILYMIDPTGTCGYSVDNQIELFQEIKTEFIDKVKIPYIIVLNKMDFASDKEMKYVIDKLKLKKKEYVKTDAKLGGNMNELLDRILEIIKEFNLMPLDLSKFRENSSLK